MITLQPVLELAASDSFALWPIAEVQTYGFMALCGELTSAEVGTAIMRIAQCNDMDDEVNGLPPRPADPIASFLHGLLFYDTPFAAGGLRVDDSVTHFTLLPGCCNGLEEWRAWYDVLDGSGLAYFGHNPSPAAERRGELVRLTADAERSDSPVVEVSVAELRQLIAGAERDLANFCARASRWALRCMPDYAESITAALARVLDIPPGQSMQA